MTITLKAIVTGGSAGIGESICQHLIDIGATVTNLDIKPPARVDEPRYHFMQVDLSDPKAAREAASEITRDGKINCLVNNAGHSFPGDLLDVSDEDFERGVNLHLRTPVILAQACVPGMKAAQFGRIVNISSRGVLGKKSRTVYSSTKAGLVGLTRSWALELGEFGITVNAIAPGPILTDLFKKNNSPELQKKLVAAAIVGRGGRPDDIARAAMFFASPENSFVTGQLLYVCGGGSLSGARW